MNEVKAHPPDPTSDHPPGPNSSPDQPEATPSSPDHHQGPTSEVLHVIYGHLQHRQLVKLTGNSATRWYHLGQLSHVAVHTLPASLLHLTMLKLPVATTGVEVIWVEVTWLPQGLGISDEDWGLVMRTGH